MPFYISGSSACSAWVLGVDSQERVIQFGISYSQFNSVFFVFKFNAGADNSYYFQNRSVSKHLFPIRNASHIHKKSGIWIPAIESRSWYSESFIQIKSLRLTFHCLPLIMYSSDDWTSKPVECNHSLITHTPIIYLGDLIYRNGSATHLISSDPWNCSIGYWWWMMSPTAPTNIEIQTE